MVGALSLGSAIGLLVGGANRFLVALSLVPAIMVAKAIVDRMNEANGRSSASAEVVLAEISPEPRALARSRRGRQFGRPASSGAPLGRLADSGRARSRSPRRLVPPTALAQFALLFALSPSKQRDHRLFLLWRRTLGRGGLLLGRLEERPAQRPLEIGVDDRRMDVAASGNGRGIAEPVCHLADRAEDVLP